MNKRYFRTGISLLLILTVLCCGTVSASAYNSIVTIESIEWLEGDEHVSSYVYPNFSVNDDPEEFFQYEELYGQGCYISTNRGGFFDNVDITVKSSDYQFDGFYIFENNGYVYLLNFESDCFDVFNDDSGHLYFYCHYDDCYIGYYILEYPFNDFKFIRNLKCSSDGTGDFMPEEFFQYFPATNLQPSYSTVDVYSYNESGDAGTVVYSADDNITSSVTINCELDRPIQMYGGTVTFSMTQEQIDMFALGKYVFKFTNTGFIPFRDCNFALTMFQLNVIDGAGDIVANPVLINDPVVNAATADATTDSVAAYSSNVKDYIVFWDNDVVGSSTYIYKCVVAFAFISDTGSCFFPGTLEIVEYSDFEDTQQHYDVLNAVNSASTDLSEKLDIVKDSIDNATQNVTGKLDDVKDGITNKLTEVKDNLLDGIKSFFIPSDEVMEEIDDKWDKLLKTRFGALYEVSDIITDFASQMSWDYVKQAGEKNTITMPSVTVKLVDTDFTFGGYEVKVVPDGFDVLTTALKGITSIVCTLMFVNALRKKYDKLVGGNGV